MNSKNGLYTAAIAAVFVSCVAHADLVFNNGLVNDFSGSASGLVIVADNPNGPPFATTLNYLAGATSTDDLNATGSSFLNVFAGSTVGDDLNVSGSSTAYMTGGTVVDDIRVRNSSVFHLSGGSIGDSVAARENATLFIYGYDFNFAYGAITAETGTLTGFLSDGTAISYGFDRGTTGAYTGTIELVYAVPSPAGLALLGLAGLVRSRRR